MVLDLSFAAPARLEAIPVLASGSAVAAPAELEFPAALGSILDIFYDLSRRLKRFFRFSPREMVVCSAAALAAVLRFARARTRVFADIRRCFAVAPETAIREIPRQKLFSAALFPEPVSAAFAIFLYFGVV